MEIANDIELAVAMGDADRLAELIELRDSQDDTFDLQRSVEE